MNTPGHSLFQGFVDYFGLIRLPLHGEPFMKTHKLKRSLLLAVFGPLLLTTAGMIMAEEEVATTAQIITSPLPVITNPQLEPLTEMPPSAPTMHFEPSATSFPQPTQGASASFPIDPVPGLATDLSADIVRPSGIVTLNQLIESPPEQNIIPSAELNLSPIEIPTGAIDASLLHQGTSRGVMTGPIFTEEFEESPPGLPSVP